MRRWALLTVVLSCSCTWVPAANAQAAGRTELEQRLLAYINERMYNCCKDVLLTRQEGDTYEGFVLFTNGQRNKLRVVVHDEGIDYEFLGWSDSEAESIPDQAESEAQRHAELRRLQDTIREQQAQIARLQGLGPAAESTRDASELAPTPPPGQVYTQQVYRRIEKGMSYAQVAGILGEAGSRISSSLFDGGVNEVWVWVNPDDSHVCIVFRDGVVLVRSQSGLGPATPRTDQPSIEVPYFDTWLLAKRIDGRVVPLDLSLGQWLNQVRAAASETVAQPRIDVIEDGNRIIVELAHDQGDPPTGETHLYLTWMSPQELDLDASELGTAERVCIPAGVGIDGKELSDPARAWEVMAALADLSRK